MTNTEKNQSVLKAAWLIALVTIASKLMGFVRDMVVANYYGATTPFSPIDIATNLCYIIFNL